MKPRELKQKQPKKAKQPKQPKQPFRQVLDNNLFILKICFSASPLYILVFILDILRNQLLIFFEHTYGIGYVLESVEYGRPFRNVAVFIIALFILIGIGMIYGAFVNQLISLKALPRMKQKLKFMLYEKARKLDLECYDNPEYYNEFVLAVSEADKQVERMLEFLNKLFTGLTVFITTGTYFIIKDWFSVSFVAVSFLLSSLLMQVLNRVNYKIRLQKNPQERKRAYVNRVFYLNDYAKELRLNPDVPGKLLDKFKAANKKIYEIDRENAKRKFILSFLRDYVSNDFISDVLYIIYLVYKATVLSLISYSSVVILFNSFGRFKRSLRTITEIYPYASETSLYVDKIRSFLNYKPRIDSRKRLAVPGKPGIFKLDNIAFSYNEGAKNVINNINMTIKPFEKVALVGYNGAGKTTLIKLLMRLYDVREGGISLNGVDIRDYDVAQYREHVGTVFQDYMLYAATVKENVLLDIGEDVPEEPVMEALEQSGFVQRLKELKQGLATPLTAEFHEDGVNLSGGEAQKLAISRAFYKNSSLIILDEPSSALDPIAEYQLNQSMLEAAANKTVVFISHRLSTTRLADRIFMLEDGRIIESGSHEELLKLDGKYAEMWRVQAGQYIAEQPV